MRDRLLVVWDDFSSFRRRHHGGRCWLLLPVAIAAVLTALIVGTYMFTSSSGDGVPGDPGVPGASAAAPGSSTPTRLMPRDKREVGHSGAATPGSVPIWSTQGKELATAWLTGFLTRSDPTDARWVAAVQDLTTPELMSDLQADGPSAIGLDGLASWRVGRMAPIGAVERPVDTESRMVLSYAVTVTDGDIEVEKPFQLYCYRDGDGQWLVASIEQPYSSEG